MDDPLEIETGLVSALKLTAEPPQAWIDAAAMIPSTLGELETIERAVESAEFRERFASDPRDAVLQAGLTPSDELVQALRSRLC